MLYVNKMDCTYCNKIFKTVSSLNHHQRTAKYCLDLQGKNIIKTNKTKKELIQDNLKQKNKIESLENKIESLDKEIERLCNIINNITIKDTVVNVNNNTVNTINMPVLNITKESIVDTVNNKLNIDHVIEGQIGVARFIIEDVLTNENGQLMLKCSDISRQSFFFKDNDGIIQKDPKANKLIQKVSNPIKTKASILLEEWARDKIGVNELIMNVHLDICGIDNDKSNAQLRSSIAAKCC